MSKRGSLILGLGAAATMLAAPFVVSACRTMGGQTRDDRAMMESGKVLENAKKECGCIAEGKKCEGKDGKCGGSCGGGG